MEISLLKDSWNQKSELLGLPSAFLPPIDSYTESWLSSQSHIRRLESVN